MFIPVNVTNSTKRLGTPGVKCLSAVTPVTDDKLITQYYPFLINVFSINGTCYYLYTKQKPGRGKGKKYKKMMHMMMMGLMGKMALMGPLMMLMIKVKAIKALLLSKLALLMSLAQLLKGKKGGGGGGHGKSQMKKTSSRQ